MCAEVVEMQDYSSSNKASAVQIPAKGIERQDMHAMADAARYNLDNVAPLITRPVAEDIYQKARENALASLRETGLPTPRLERWKYTNLQGLYQQDWFYKAEEKDSGAANAELPEALSPLRAIFVNGVFDAARSTLPEGMNFIGALDALDDAELAATLFNNAPLDVFNDQALWALNSAYAECGFVLDIPNNMIVEQPIEVLFLGDNKKEQLSQTRLMVRLGKGAQTKLIERYSSYAGALNTAVTVMLGDNARLDHSVLEENMAQGFYALSTAHVVCARDSHYEAFVASIGDQHTNRKQVWAQLTGSNAHCQVNGVQLSGGDEHKEMTLLVHHEAPHCTSDQDVRHIGAGHGRAIFQGKVYVDQVAQQTEAFQMSRGILLSERAEVNTKPELEIYADDVKCSHGATTGQIDDKALFYMQARGIDEALARKMLLQSFASEVFEDMPEAIGREQFDKMIDVWLTSALK